MGALGRHLLVELFDCDREILADCKKVKDILVEAARRARATIVDVSFHEFNPFGASGAVLIAKSHLTIHTWPEYCFAAVDVLFCDETMLPETAVDYCTEQFKAGRTSVREEPRGKGLATGSPAAPQPAARHY